MSQQGFQPRGSLAGDLTQATFPFVVSNGISNARVNGDINDESSLIARKSHVDNSSQADESQAGATSKREDNSKELKQCSERLSQDRVIRPSIKKELSKRERNSILYAVAIGDGYIEPKRTVSINGKEFEKNCKINIVHCTKQVSYLRWKAKFLSKILNRTIYIRRYYQKSGFTPGWIVKISIGNKLFNKVRSKLYLNGKKTITRKLLNRLDERGLAIWYMDDGCLVKRYNKKKGDKYIVVEISTCCHSEDEHKIIVNYFKDKWNIRCQYRKRAGYFISFFKRKDAERFIEIVSPYIIPSMNYKIDTWKHD